MSIYIVSHLRLKRPFDKDFRVIYVGPMSGPTSPDDFAVTDAIQAPHIAGKNKTFCELTALYQMLNLHAASKDELIGLKITGERCVDTLREWHDGTPRGGLARRHNTGEWHEGTPRVGLARWHN